MEEMLQYLDLPPDKILRPHHLHMLMPQLFTEILKSLTEVSDDPNWVNRVYLTFQSLVLVAYHFCLKWTQKSKREFSHKLKWVQYKLTIWLGHLTLEEILKDYRKKRGLLGFKVSSR